eukprot:scaffold2917_cov191-Amphora_coffeaeformis.AAC.11
MKRISLTGHYMGIIFVVTACYVLTNLASLPLVKRSPPPCPGQEIINHNKGTDLPLLLHQDHGLISNNNTDTTAAAATVATTTTTTTTATTPLTLRMGDLPGYTGWARPIVTTAAWYEVTTPTVVNVATTVGVPFVYTVHCRHQKCRTLNALFDTRAYGPAILTGTVQKSHPHNGTYTWTIIFHDPGEYVVEIVLAFSHVNPLATFPCTTEPLYEGYLLPGLPTTIQVVDDKNNQVDTNAATNTVQPRPVCRARDLYEKNPTSALQKARWKVTQRNRGTGGIPNPHMNATFDEYKYGAASIGFVADYVYRDCDLPNLESLVKQSLARLVDPPLDHENDVIVFIGDSHMRKQYKLFLEHFGDRLTSVYLKTNDGLLVRFPEIRLGLEKITAQLNNAKHRGKAYILFNAGLHEIDILCSQKRVRSRGRVISTPDDNFSCTQQYRSNLMELTKLVLDVPGALRVFQSTSAGWIKWGN